MPVPEQELIKLWPQRFTKDFQQIDPDSRSTNSWPVIRVNFMRKQSEYMKKLKLLLSSARGPSISPMNKITTTEQESIKIH